MVLLLKLLMIFWFILTIKTLNTAKDRLKEAQEKSPDEGNRVSRICLHDEIIDKILAELK